MRPRLATPVLVGVAACAVACAAPPRDGSPGSSTAPTATTPDELTVTGVVRAGVEPGCLLLHTGGPDYLLLGGDQSELRPGQSVRVRGTPRPATPTTCQQGVPLTVHEVRPA